MSVTIDSLDIQIKSSAASATQSIEALARALGELKANSNVSKVANSLSKLSSSLDQLKNQSGAQLAMTNVAKAMKSLNGVEKPAGFMSAVNALKRATATVATLPTGNLGGVIQMANTIGSLSAVAKPSGFTSVLTQLKKIPEITQSLDDSIIEQFTAKIKALSDALEPLAVKINDVANGFSRLPERIKQAVSATNALGESTKKASKLGKLLNFSAMFGGVKMLAQSFRSVINSVGSIINEAMQWDGISFRFGRAFGDEAEEVYDWALKLEEVLRINSQQFMQYSSMFGSILKGFGLAQDKVTTMSVGLTELSYDIWAANNDRYKSLESAYEAVRSAITGEIEPIRNAGIALTQASMQEYLDSVGLAAVKVANLSEAQKSQVRYAVMAKAAMDQGIIGTYAREMNTAEGAVRAFSQQLKGLAQAFGALLVPAVSTIITWISAFISILHSAVLAIGRLFGITRSIGSSSSGLDSIADSAGDAEAALGGAGGAAKKLKDYMMGFDELNVINPDTGGGGGGGGSALGDLELPDLKQMWDESTLKQAMDQIDEYRQKILDFFDKWGVLIAVVAGALAALALWTAFKGSPLETFIKTLGTSGFASAIESVSKSLGSLARPLTNISGLFSTVATSIGSFVTKAVAALGGGTITAIIIAMASVVLFLARNWDEVVEAVKRFYKVNLESKFKKIKKSLEPILPLLQPIVDWIKNLDFSSWVDAFEVFGGLVFALISGPIAGAISAIATIFSGLAQAITGVVEIISGLVNAVVSLLNGDLNGAAQALRDTWQGVVDLFVGLEEATCGAIREFVQGVIDWFTELWDVLVGHSIVPDTINAIVEWFTGLPGAILGVIQGFVLDIIGYFTNIYEAIGNTLEETKKTIAEKWQGIKSWWDSNVAPKFTKTYWLNKFDVVRSAIREKIEAAKGALQEKWAEIQSWFDSTVAPMLELSYWTDKLNTFLDFGRTIVDNIKAGLTEKWEELVNWWKNLELPKFKVNIPKFSFSGLFDAKTNSTPDVNVGWVVKTYAKGGFPSAGEMFVAREAGPELVGSINGRTAVANNDQIVAAVSQGVYEAVRSAMSGQNDSEGSFNVNVFLDSKQITAAVEKRQRERGVAMMTGGVAFA